MSLRFALVLALCVGHGLASGPRAEAAPADAQTAARAAFERGRTLYRLTRFAEALDAFSAAYQALPEPAFLFNIAQCLRELGRDKEAIKVYRSYLSTAPADDSSRPEIERNIARLEERVAARTQEAERARRALEQREAELAQAALIAAERTRPKHDSARRANAFIVSGGVLGFLGLCGLSAGVATAVQANEARDALQSDARAGSVYDPSVGQAYDRNRALSIGFFAAGAGLAGLGAALLGRGVWERRALQRSTP